MPRLLFKNVEIRLAIKKIIEMKLGVICYLSAWPRRVGALTVLPVYENTRQAAAQGEQ
jgi:hypothetical protein